MLTGVDRLIDRMIDILAMNIFHIRLTVPLLTKPTTLPLPAALDFAHRPRTYFYLSLCNMNPRF